MRSLVKRILPAPLKRLLTDLRTRLDTERKARLQRAMNERAQAKFESLSIAETFGRIYSSGGWGGNGDVNLSSGVGSTGPYVRQYCALLEPLIRKHNVRSVADLGCGNFNTGKFISQWVGRYIGVDIAAPVISANTRAYATENISFLQADLTTDPLPAADAAVLRQVLQHLSNAEIRSVLDNSLRIYPLLFITEHVYLGPRSKPNLDFGHGPGTRVPMKSGVFIDQPPFNLLATPVGDIAYAPNEVLRTWTVERALPTSRARAYAAASP